MKYTGSAYFLASSNFLYSYICYSWYLRTSSLKFLGKFTVLERLSWGLLFADLAALELPLALFSLYNDLDAFLFLFRSFFSSSSPSMFHLFWLLLRFVSKNESPYLEEYLD